MCEFGNVQVCVCVCVCVCFEMLCLPLGGPESAYT